MKIVSLVAENVKRLRAVEIKPDGSLVQIAGKNGSGKTSVLDSIYYALAGGNALPSKPVRRGEESARIRLDLGEIVVTRRFGADGKTSLVVEGANGARFPSPQRMLDALVGSIAFDPLEFTRMEPREQFETLRGLVKLDVDIDALDGKSKTDFEARTDVNRRSKSLRAQASAIVVPDDLPAQPIDTAALLRQMQEAGEHNAGIEQRKGRREQAAREVEAARREAENARTDGKKLRQRAADLITEAERAEADAVAKDQRAAELDAKLQAAEPLPAPIDASTIRAEVEQAGRTNKLVEQRDRRTQIEADAEKAEAEAEQLTANIAERARVKTEAIAAAKMPIEGLTFGEQEILLNGLPLDQASDAERLRLSVGIAMAANPKLRVLRIRNGDVLDPDSLALLQQMVEAADYQCWMEVVRPTGPVSVVMEDGMSRAPAKAEAQLPLTAAE